MSATLQQVAEQAIALSRDDRARLVDLLLASLPSEADAEAESAWQREIERRVGAVDAGTAHLVAAHEVHERSRKIFGS